MTTPPVFLPGEVHGQRSLEGYSSCSHKESDTIQTYNTFSFFQGMYATEERERSKIINTHVVKSWIFLVGPYFLKWFLPPVCWVVLHVCRNIDLFGSKDGLVVSSLTYLPLYSPWNSPDQKTGVGSHSLVQEIFPTQGSDPGLPHCRQIDSLPAELPEKPCISHRCHLLHVCAC